jgi:hypothetical protein
MREQRAHDGVLDSAAAKLVGIALDMSLVFGFTRVTSASTA